MAYKEASPNVVSDTKFKEKNRESQYKCSAAPR